MFKNVEGMILGIRNLKSITGRKKVNHNFNYLNDFLEALEKTGLEKGLAAQGEILANADSFTVSKDLIDEWNEYYITVNNVNFYKGVDYNLEFNENGDYIFLLNTTIPVVRSYRVHGNRIRVNVE